MEESRHRVRQALSFLLVCVLHGVLGWFLLATSAVMKWPAQSSRLTLTVISLHVPLPTAAPEKHSPEAQRAVPRAARRHDLGDDAAAPPKDPRNATTTAPIDWNAELARAGRAATGIDLNNTVKDFGIPHGPPPTMADYPQFDWDYARTHRVESIPAGGVIIHLNDNCVLLLSPLPMAMCSPFKHRANGDLFKHMHDPDRPGDPRVP